MQISLVYILTLLNTMQFVSAGNWPDEALTTGNDFNSARMKEDNHAMKSLYAELKAQWYAINPEDPGAKKFWDHYHPKKRSSNYEKLQFRAIMPARTL